MLTYDDQLNLNKRINKITGETPFFTIPSPFGDIVQSIIEKHDEKEKELQAANDLINQLQNPPQPVQNPDSAAPISTVDNSVQNTTSGVTA